MSPGAQISDSISAAVNPGGSRDVDFNILCAGHTNPAQHHPALAFMTENGRRHYFEIVDINVGLIEPVEHYHSLNFSHIKLIYHMKNVGKPVSDLYRYRYCQRLFQLFN